MATGCEQGVIAGGGVGASAVDAPAKESGCARCVALQQQLEAQRWELVRERCAARSFRSLHERACARERAKHEEVKALRADISRAAALRKEVETLKARLAALSGAERSSPDRLRMKHRALRSRVPGAQMRYFVRANNGEPLAVLGFGAAAWKTAPRDEFIGWSPAVRQRNLALVVNNARFLILPWIRIGNLASHLLAQLQRRLPHDWERRYALRPVLLETFCESARFLGTCYQSANWLCVGHTQGRGKLDVHRQSSVPVKSVWLKPLHKNWRQILCR